MFVLTSLRRSARGTATQRRCYDSTFYIIFPVRICPRENHVPEPRNLSFRFISPSEVAIVTIKAFGKNLHGK